MSPKTAPAEDAADAVLAARLFALDPAALGGVVFRGPGGPDRERFLSALARLLPKDAPVRRLPVSVDDERLLGGLDLAATLASGRPVERPGLLAEADRGVVVAPMAERLDRGQAARIAAALDQGSGASPSDRLQAVRSSRFGLVLLDEGVGEEEAPPAALLERCGPRLRLPATGLPDRLGRRRELEAARRRLKRQGPASPALVEALCRAAEALGLVSARDPLLALAWARASAALAGRPEPGAADAAAAARLVLLTRAGLEPPPAGEDAEAQGIDEGPADPPEASDAHPREEGQEGSSPPVPPDPGEEQELEVVITAVRAALPDGVLDGTSKAVRTSAAGPRGRGAGDRKLSPLRGRPLRSRPGSIARGGRLDLAATLKAAAPFARIRPRPPHGGLAVRPADFHIRRFVQEREATVVFLVDASGSAALQRLGEAKGAVEILLAQAYVSRTRAALVVFRGSGAEVVLEPTRSLARAKRRLADLAGGGGTPLASALERGLALAREERRRQRTPLIVVLTDGRANIARDGSQGRAAAEEDARVLATAIRAEGVSCVYIDTAARPAPDAERWAKALGARYLPLPFADARALGALAGALRAEVV